MKKKTFKRKRLNIVQFIMGAIVLELIMFYFTVGIPNVSSEGVKDNTIQISTEAKELDTEREDIIEETTDEHEEPKQQEVAKVEPKVVEAKASSNKNSEYEYMVDFIAHLINGEAGLYWCTDEHQQLVGYVFCNRVRAKDFPSTFEGVLKGGYACAYDGNFDKKPTQRARQNAKIVVDNYLAGTIPVSADLIYQAEFVQGSKVYKQLGNTYFCYR